MNISEIIKSLEMGVCPKELDYSEANCHHEIDWEKVIYNTRYNSFEYFDNKLHNDLKNIPAYDKIVDLIVDKNKDNNPLKEMEQRIKEATEEENNTETYKDVQGE